jgi:hypothetical protein
MVTPLRKLGRVAAGHIGAEIMVQRGAEQQAIAPAACAETDDTPSANARSDTVTDGFMRSFLSRPLVIKAILSCFYASS